MLLTRCLSVRFLETRNSKYNPRKTRSPQKSFAGLFKGRGVQREDLWSRSAERETPQTALLSVGRAAPKKENPIDAQISNIFLSGASKRLCRQSGKQRSSQHKTSIRKFPKYKHLIKNWIPANITGIQFFLWLYFFMFLKKRE